MATDLDQFRAVPGWITLSEAADELGITKQAAHKMVKEKKWRTIRVLGKKKIYCVKPQEVAEQKEARELGISVALLRERRRAEEMAEAEMSTS